MPHRIHLGGPWEYFWRTFDEGNSPQGVGTKTIEEYPQRGRANMEATWEQLFEDQPGEAVFRRAFHWPTPAEPPHEVWLLFEGIGGQGTVQLNDVILGNFDGANEQRRFLVTDQLILRNQITVRMTCEPGHRTSHGGGLFGPVILEIRDDE